MKKSSAKIKVPGFSFSGISAGIKKTGKPDLAIIFSESPAVIAGVFTTNKVKAAPVKLDMKRIRSSKGQAIVINSGNANACTGEAGHKNAEEMTRLAAEELGIRKSLVYVSSTGKIGKPLPMAKIRKAIPLAAKNLSPLSLDKAASAIMTTDTVRKVVSKKIRIGGRTATIAAMAKGSGMISPDMATMLSYIITDIAITPHALKSALKESVKRSFNRLIVDNDMSTNDTVMIMANGKLENTAIKKTSAEYRKFEDTLSELTYALAKMIAVDGEGATKFIEINVKGARSERDAEKAARAVANSMLVKTAIYGNDPNWGRIISAVGYSGAAVNEKKVDLYINKCKLVSCGAENPGVKISKRLLADKDINITIDLGAGNKSSSVLTCDLTEEYIKINAEYET